ncbi:MAG TPA: CPBP family intramembrane glutamic endopeptidase [Anaerolineales bacterium]|nr:CPBP family intramembrane glutamic endopeptidase [Anaerolineales bacterium]
MDLALRIPIKTYVEQIIRFLLLLLAIQIGRSLINMGLWRILHPAADSPLWAYMDVVAFGFIGIGLLIFFRPSAGELGLGWRGVPRWELIAYILVGTVTFVSVLGTYFLEPDLLAININAALVIPIFEELLFRGWVWGQLEKALPARRSGFIHWLATSFLFGCWQFGYVDIYLLQVAPVNPGLDWGSFFLVRFLTTLIIGLIVGLPRWRTGRVYGSVILHSLINLFGRW